MQFEDLCWMDVEHYLHHHGDRVVVITGACEQHAYLSLLSDIRAPLAIARAAAQIEPTLIAPPLPFGVSPYFTAYPGTISLRAETFITLVREVIEQLLAQGFRRVLLSNGHGGNTGLLLALLSELADAHREARFALFEWWRHEKVSAVAQAAGLAQHHANWSEALPMNVVGPLPEGIKELPSTAALTFPHTVPAAQVREILGDGSFGGPYRAAEETLEALFNAAVGAMVEALREL